MTENPNEAPLDSQGVGLAAREWLGTLRPGEPLPVGGLTLWPLTRASEDEAGVDLAHEALGGGSLTIAEQEQAQVSKVRANNKGERPVLILEGESLQGALQNRMVVDSLLVGAGRTADLSVGCVEQGRWGWGRASRLTTSDVPVDPEIRSTSTCESVHGTGIDQGRLWRDVHGKLARWRTQTASSCYTTGSTNEAQRTRRRVSEIEPLPNQIGVLVTRGDQLVGLEVLSDPALWRRAAGRLLPSYLLVDFQDDEDQDAENPEAEDQETKDQEPRQHGAEWWLGRLASCSIKTTPAAEESSALVLESPGMCGRGIANKERLLHVAVFPAPESA